ncbi:MAG: Crp/Fnr family transcriptional regulator [bacterium]|nr:MAG: Crp/Fnr family transcriptional regulator [bacterium]
MIQENPTIILFKSQLRDSLLKETVSYQNIKIAKHDSIYNCGDSDNKIYFVESGQVKLVITSPEGKECILVIHTKGDIFGELCLSGLSARLETATAMEQTYLKQIPAAQFLMLLSNESLLESFIKYLAIRIADQQQVISTLVTVNSEQRLGKTLLQLAHSLGKQDPRSILIALKISHEELAAMIGTTRPRISLFMRRFRNLGLIETTKEHFLIVKELKLTNYLAQIA